SFERILSPSPAGRCVLQLCLEFIDFFQQIGKGDRFRNGALPFTFFGFCSQSQIRTSVWPAPGFGSRFEAHS
ncbi:MAG: hypothetical protein WBX35_23475, partial [Pseudolabrys sp.]